MLLRVRAALTGLDRVFDPTGPLQDAQASLTLLSTMATRIAYDPQTLSAVQSVVETLDHSMLSEPMLPPAGR